MNIEDYDHTVRVPSTGDKPFDWASTIGMPPDESLVDSGEFGEVIPLPGCESWAVGGDGLHRDVTDCGDMYFDPYVQTIRPDATDENDSEFVGRKSFRPSREQKIRYVLGVAATVAVATTGLFVRSCDASGADGELERQERIGSTHSSSYDRS
ncbi:hypothetical protein KBC31_00010 [Candidatus Saccharibacteria bacterium]|nr:hypothetical protein [Candidatus Saccharibacteria bacterium]